MTRPEPDDCGNTERWRWARTIQAQRLLRELAIDSALTAAHRDARCATGWLDTEAGCLATTAPHEP